MSLDNTGSRTHHREGITHAVILENRRPKKNFYFDFTWTQSKAIPVNIDGTRTCDSMPSSNQEFHSKKDPKKEISKKIYKVKSIIYTSHKTSHTFKHEHRTNFSIITTA